MLKLSYFILSFSLIWCNLAVANIQEVTKDIKLYKSPSQTRPNLLHWIIKNSKIKIIKNLNSGWTKVKITYEPYKKGRNNRKGSIGWIKRSNLEQSNSVHKSSSSKRKSLKKAVVNASNILKSKPEPNITASCDSKDSTASITESYLNGCEILSAEDLYEKPEANSKLAICLKSIISIISEGARTRGNNFENHHGKKFKPLSRKKVFQNMFKKLNSKEQEYAALIFTSLGEAKDIGLEHREYENGNRRVHHEEMMAIMLVLENRRDKTNNKIDEEQKEIIKLKSSYPNQSLDAIVTQLKKEERRLDRKSRSLQKKQLHLRKGIRSSLIKVKKQISLLKKYSSRPPRKVNSLDMALDSSGKQFNVYFPQSKPPIYPHWFKVMSSDFEKFQPTAIDAFIQYRKNKSSVKDLNKNILHYYANHIKRPKWAKPSKVSIPVFYKNGQKLRLKTDPYYSKQNSRISPHSCAENLTTRQRKEHKKTGHCFYEGIPYVFYGHPFRGDKK